MATKKIHNLREVLFEQLNRLNDTAITGEALGEEVFRGEAIVKISAAIVNTAKAEIDYMRASGRVKQTSDFIDITGEDNPLPKSLNTSEEDNNKPK